MVNATVWFIDHNNQVIHPTLSSTLTLSATASNDASLGGQCQLALYNTNINPQGQFGEQRYKFSIANEIIDQQGNKYTLQQMPADITLSGNTAIFIPMTLQYQQ